MSTVQPEELSLVPIESDESVIAAATSGLRRDNPILALVPKSRSVPTALSERAHRGPGWFDSSWDLRDGCEVREVWPVDVGLREWIESWFSQPANGESRSFGET